MEAGACDTSQSDRSRIVVVSQLNSSCNHDITLGTENGPEVVSRHPLSSVPNVTTRMSLASVHQLYIVYCMAQMYEAVKRVFVGEILLLFIKGQQFSVL